MRRCGNPFNRGTLCNNANEDALRKVSQKVSELLTIKAGTWLCPTCRKLADEKVKKFFGSQNSEDIIKGNV